MDGSIEKLSIEITSSAINADEAITTLVKKLGSLDRALSRVSVDTNFAGQMQILAKGISEFNVAFGGLDAAKIRNVGSSLKDLAAGVNNLNKAIHGVDFMSLANQASQLETALDKKLNQTMDEFGIKGKKNVNAVKSEMYGLMQALKSGDIETAISKGTTGRAVDAIKKYASFDASLGPEAYQAERLISAVKAAGAGGIGIDSNLKSEVADIKATMDKYQNIFTTGGATQGISEFITQNHLLIDTTLNEADQFAILANMINEAVATLQRAKTATIGYEEAVRMMGLEEDAAAKAVAEMLGVYESVTAAQNRATQAQRQGAESMRTSQGAYKQFAEGLREVSTINVPEGKASEITRLANAVNQLGYTSTQKAIQNIPHLTREINNMLTVLSKSPRISSDIARLIRALAQLSKQGGKIAPATNAIANGINKTGSAASRSTPRVRLFGNALQSISAQSISVLSGLRRLAGMFGTVYASLFMFVGAFHKLKEAIGYAADLTEIQNVVDVTFGNAASKVDEFTQTSIKDFGINELSVKQFASRYQSMGVAMGITNEQVKEAHEYLSQFRTPTGAINGYNELSDSMADMSINLTKLTGDLASFYDQEQSDVAQALQSGIFAGQTRPMRQYGVDLTQATLQEWALSQGINANIASMTQAEKTMLRYEYAMQRLGMAQGDFQRTSKTWANQVRVLKQQFQALGAVIGQGLIQALKPALIAMNAFLSRVIEFAKKVLNALGKIFGWKVDISAGALSDDLGGAEEAASGLGDALGGAGDAADGAADSVKELNKQLQSFDKLNVLTTTETGGSGGSGGGGGGSGSGGGGGGAGGGAGDVQASIEKTEGLFESNINNLFSLGTSISKALQNAMDSIDWDSIYEKARNFGTGLAQFLNGLFAGSPEHNVFASLGRTVAGAINTALNFFDAFAEEFNFDEFGENLASFFVETVENIDWTMAGSAFHKWMQGIKDAFTSFVSYLWENRDEVWEAIKDFFSEVTIEDIAIFIGLITISKIGKWVLAEGVLSLAAQAIGALFKGIGLTISANILGCTIGEVAELGLGPSMMLITQSIAESLGFGSVAAMAGVISIPISLVILSAISWKAATERDEEYENALADYNRMIEAGLSEELAKDTPTGQKLLAMRKERLGNLLGSGYSDMFSDYDLDENGNLKFNMTGYVGLEWVKGKWTTLKEWLSEKWSDLTGGLSGSAWAETWSAITAQFKVALDWVKDKWTDFKTWLKEKLGFDPDETVSLGDVAASIGKIILGLSTAFHFLSWLKEKIFGSSDNGTTDLGNRNVTIGKIILTLITPFGSFLAWVKEQIFGKDDTGTTDLGDRNVTIGKLNLGNASGGLLGGAGSLILDATANLTGWKKGNNYNDTVGGMNSEFASRSFSWAKKYDTVGGMICEFSRRTFSWPKRADTVGGMICEFFKRTFSWSKSADTVGGMICRFDSRKFGSSFSSTISATANFTDYTLGSKLRNLVVSIGAAFKADGGVYTSSGWKPIQGYATGGMPSSAEIFMARENGMPELVGTLGGHTAVMNNSQIVSSVSAGVAKANAQQNELLRTQNALLRQILAKETGITSGDIFDAVRSENRNYTNRTGRSAFSY